MKITVNGQVREVQATCLTAVLDELGFASQHSATALNGEFVPRNARAGTSLACGDELEVLTPRQGG